MVKDTSKYYYSQCCDDVLVPLRVCPAHMQPLQFNFLFISNYFLFCFTSKEFIHFKRHQIHIPTTSEGSTRKTEHTVFFSMSRTCGCEPPTCGSWPRTCGPEVPHVPFRQNQTTKFQHLPHVRQWLPHVRRLPCFGPKFASKSHSFGSVCKTLKWIFSLPNYGSKSMKFKVQYTTL